MKSKYSDTYFAFHYAVKHQDYTKWFSPVILAVDTWSIHVWQTEATRARCYLRREREGVKTQHNWHNSLACQRWPVYSAALSAVLTFLLAAFQPTTPVFPSTLALNMEDAYTVLCDIRARNKVFRRACSQVILLNHQIEAAKARYDRARAVKRLPSDTPTDSSSQVSRAFAILSTSSPVSSVKKSRACKPNYGNSLVVFTTLKNQTSLILTTSLATAKYTTGICLLRALIRASTLSKEIIHAVAATS